MVVSDPLARVKAGIASDGHSDRPRRVESGHRQRQEPLTSAIAGATLKQMLQYQSPPLDLAFQALSDPGRRAMVERLSVGPASVSELAKPLPMTLSAVVQHLKVLEEAGLVKSEKVGRVRTCALEIGTITQVERWIAERKRFWEQQYDHLDAYLAQTVSEEEHQ